MVARQRKRSSPGLGTLIVALVGAGLDFFGRSWGLHALTGGALLMIVGTQVLALARSSGHW